VKPEALLTAILCDKKHEFCDKIIIVLKFVTSFVQINKAKKFSPVAEIGVKSERAEFSAAFYKLVHILISNVIRKTQN